jgi:hypothetical protein
MRSAMSNQGETIRDQDDALDTFAAELTDAAYPIALKYGISGSSLDLELEIWKTFIELVHRRAREVFSPAAVP